MFSPTVPWSSHLDIQAPGIWRFHRLLPGGVSAARRLSLGEGQTPLLALPELAGEFGIAALSLKREDTNPGGSHKDRSLAWRMSLATAVGTERVVIPSTGNAAISTLGYARAVGIAAVVLVRPDIQPAKLAALVALNYGQILLSSRTLELAEYLANQHGFTNLRPSRDPESSIGYQTLAYEIAHAAPTTTDIFTYTTSGSSFVGMARGLAQLVQLGLLNALPALHAVRRAPSATWSEPDVMKSALFPELDTWLQQSGGQLWTVEGKDASAAEATLETKGIRTSGEGAAVLSAIRAYGQKTGQGSRVVGILTGKARPSRQSAVRMPVRLESEAEMNDWVDSTLRPPAMV